MQTDIRGYHAPGGDVAALLSRLRSVGAVQLVRADRVYGRDHLAHAARLAARAVAEGRARSADLPTETLLYAAGERQVGKALAFLGVTPQTHAIALVAWDVPRLDAFAAAEGWTRDDALLEGDIGVLDAFGVSAAERGMLPPERWGDIILERVALVDVLKT